MQLIKLFIHFQTALYKRFYSRMDSFSIAMQTGTYGILYNFCIKERA